MPKRVVDLREQRALLDIASYGRRGPGHRPLTRAEVEHVSRTARHVPEVMIKVSGGARSVRGVQAHLDYIGREGEGVIETDDGAQLQEKGFEKALVKDLAPIVPTLNQMRADARDEEPRWSAHRILTDRAANPVLNEHAQKHWRFEWVGVGRCRICDFPP